MKGRVGAPALYPLVWPEARPVSMSVDVEAVAQLFSRAERAYRERRYDQAREGFLTVARRLLEASESATDPAAPDLAGARTVCYFNAVLAAVQAEDGSVAEVQRWVGEHDEAGAEAVREMLAELTTE